MAIASITTWLDNPQRSYHHGKALYEQYGNSASLLALIRSGSGNYHLSKLKEGLELVNKQCNLEPKPIVVGTYVKPEKPDLSKKNPDLANAPDAITEIRDEKNSRYAQARRLFENIRIMDSREHRLQAGLELLDHMDFVNDSWEVIDEWKESGKVREIQKVEAEKEVAELTMTELVKESNNLPTYISKDKKNLAAAKTPASKSKYANRLEWHEHRLRLVKKRLESI